MAIEIFSDQPARFDRAVVFACDNNYAKYALFAASQIAALAPDRDFDICLCSTEDLRAVPSLDALSIRRCRVDTGGALSALRFDARRSEATYLRLALPAAFAGQYQRLLYLDSDVFAQSGDFSALLGLDPGDKPLAAVRDNSQWRTPGRRIDSFRAMGLPAVPYFNAGVLLIDVDRYNDTGVLGRCFDFAAAHPTGLLHMDQDLLNGALMGEWAEISPVWNWQYTWASRMFEAMEDAHLVHFIGRKKPWNHSEGELPLRFRRAYRAFFDRHFPEDPPLGEDGPPPLADPARLRRSLMKHMLSAGKMSAYLGRFSDDLSVVDAR